MIEMIRVDKYLIHSRFFVGWYNYIKNKTVLVISNRLATDYVCQTLYKTMIPKTVTLEFYSLDDIKQINYKNKVIVTESLDIALTICKLYGPTKVFNIASTKTDENRKQIIDDIYLSRSEIICLKEMKDSGIQVMLQEMPNQIKFDIVDL